MLIIKEFAEIDSNIWNKFVENHSDSTLYHLYEWKRVYEQSYNLKTLYLGLYLSDKLVGIFPSVFIKRPFSKGILISLPFSNYAGVLFERTIQENTILESLNAYLKNKNIAGFENRKICTSNLENSSEFTLKRKLPESEQILWKELDAKVRNQIRKARSFDLTLKWGTDQIDALYDIYSRNMLSLGTPVHSKVFLKLMVSEFPNYVDILTVRHNEKPIAAMLLIKYKKQLADPIASSLKKYLHMNPNMFLYWGALQYGCENDYNEFDFGRSSINSGTYKFKLQWNAVPYSLSYDFYALDNNERKSTVALYRGKKAELFSTAWKKIPYNLALWLGPKLRKYIP